MKKICRICSLDKDESEFYYYISSERFHSECKSCSADAQRIYVKKHKKEIRTRQKQWNRDNKERCRIYRKRSYRIHKEKRDAETREWQANNKEGWKAIQNRASVKYRSGTFGKLNSSLSAHISRNLKGKKSGRRWETVVGYTVGELKEHLEKQFTEGMNWDNYGKWHIDHKIPKSFFQFTDDRDVEFKMCWRLENLQPLWATDNVRKNNKIIKVA